MIVDDIVLVDIDEKSLQKYGQYPFPRNIYRDVLLNTSPTNTHVINIVLVNPIDSVEMNYFAEGLINRLTIISAGAAHESNR